jgi:hypothetical protein
LIAIIFAWLSLDALIARGYGSMMVMPSSIPIVHNVQKQYGLHGQEIMVEIIRGSEVSKDNSDNEKICKKPVSIPVSVALQIS